MINKQNKSGSHNMVCFNVSKFMLTIVNTKIALGSLATPLVINGIKNKNG
jgi:hypothetical protein